MHEHSDEACKVTEDPTKRLAYDRDVFNIKHQEVIIHEDNISHQWTEINSHKDETRKSDYELQREKNITRNQEFLESIGPCTILFRRTYFNIIIH